MIIDSAKYSCAAGHEINEDSCLCSAENGIFIVADGLGGHSDGEKASLAAVEFFKGNYRGGCSNELILQLLEGANTEVLQKGDGGKTTVAAAFAENGNFHYANAGDSRVYYFRNGRIIAQTKDHSVCQASVDMGMIRPEDIRGNEDRSRLLKVLGSEEKLNIKKEYPPIRIQNGDAFLVCSDGFWEYVYENEMEADLLKSDNSEAWLKYMLKRHIHRAENKGDNYTAVCGIIYLDGSENFVLPSGQTVQNIPEKSGQRSLVPVIAGGTVAIAAVIALSVSVFLRGANDEVTVPEITETVSVSETTVVEEKTTKKTTKANEDGNEDNKENNNEGGNENDNEGGNENNNEGGNGNDDTPPADDGGAKTTTTAAPTTTTTAAPTTTTVAPTTTTVAPTTTTAPKTTTTAPKTTTTAPKTTTTAPKTTTTAPTTTTTTAPTTTTTAANDKDEDKDKPNDNNNGNDKDNPNDNNGNDKDNPNDNSGNDKDSPNDNNNGNDNNQGGGNSDNDSSSDNSDNGGNADDGGNSDSQNG